MDIKRAVSLSDVAKRIGVSAMTVSRVVNGSGPVSQRTREKVLRAIGSLGYRKDVFASINASKRKGITPARHAVINFPLRYLAEDNFVNFFAAISLRLISELQGLGIHCSLAHFDNRAHPSSLEPILNCDVVVYCGDLSAEARNLMNELNPSAKSISICFPMPDVPGVNPDDIGGGQLAAEHFHRLGHSHVLSVAPMQHPCFEARHTALTSGLWRLNPRSTVDLVDASVADPAVLEATLADRLDAYFRDHAPTGVFVPNGYNTMIVYRYLRRRGVRIPDDIGLLGYDDLPFYDYLDTPLSRLVFSRDAVAVAAASLVESVIAGKIHGQYKAVIPVRLVDHHSVIGANRMTRRPGRGRRA